MVGEIVAAVIGALLAGAASAFVTYRIAHPLGVKQGREQLLHERSVTALTEVRRRLLGIRADYRRWLSRMPGRDDEEAGRTEEKTAAAQSFYEEQRVALEPNTRRTVEGIFSSLSLKHSTLTMKLSVGEAIGDGSERQDELYRAGAEAAAWIEGPFSASLDELEELTAGLMGADQK